MAYYSPIQRIEVRYDSALIGCQIKHSKIVR
jgi:hypothetical protein